MAKSIIGHFNNRDDANRAVARLLELRLIDEGTSQIIDQDLADMGGTAPRTSGKLDEKRDESFGDRISRSFRHLFGTDEASTDRDFYAESVRRGDVLVIVNVERDEDADRIADELDAQGSVDTDKRAAYLRESGFERFDTQNAMPFSTDQTEKYRRDYTDWESRRAGAPEDEAVIPVVEEEVKIGKREVPRRGVRVLSRITEKPIEETVVLREEKVEVERRPTDRTLGKGEAMEAFKEGAIEMTERAEEAVVSKEAKVVEEVAVKKRVQEREEKVRETARRQDVEIQEAGDTTKRPIPPGP